MTHRRPLLLSVPALLAGMGGARAETDFARFLADVRAEAVGDGVRAATVDRAFAGVRLNAKVLELDSRTPEGTQSWDRYRSSRVSDQRVGAGRAAMAANAAVLAEVGRRYGVDPAIIVAIWGLETNYGGYTGGFSVIEALASLALDGRRDGMFRRELVSALKILDHGDITPARMTGSYAGAMGQPQFMPSSYLTYAVSYDGGARRDIWDNKPDVFVSIGNYMARSGWRAGEPWGQRVMVPAGFGVARDAKTEPRALREWGRMGVTRDDGSALPATAVPGAVVMPDGAGGEAYMAYANFGVIRLYNHSDLYALSVGLLADRLAA